MNDGGAQTRVKRFARIVCDHLAPRADILEIGVGSGELATMLRGVGHTVVGIDRRPRDEFPAIASTFEAYEPAQQFNCVAAQLVLHHADDLEVFIAKMTRLAAGGIVAIADYGWERSDDAAFREARGDLHTSREMLAALDLACERRFYEDAAYSSEGDGPDRIAFYYIGSPRT
jgi:2-polyprenyl-3-methyl-5-hydroxy-6-metoxy-1,4-benzoquinol methylase